MPGGPVDYVNKTITVDAMDRAGNRAPAVEMTYTQDNVPPALTVEQAAGGLLLGERQTVFQGTVHDAGPGPRVSLRVRAPDGKVSWKNVARDGERWWYEMSGDQAGRYTFTVQAIDLLGNYRAMGSYTVDVTCTDARLETALTVERQGDGNDYVVMASVLNTGPDPLPEGVPITLYANDTRLGETQPMPALAQDQAYPVSAAWTRPGPEGYTFTAIVNEPPAAVLCKTPTTGTAEVAPEAGPESGSSEPQPDLRLSLSVEPAMAAPGDVITYTLVYSNAGPGLATGVLISDTLPVALQAPVYEATGAAVALIPSEPSYAWTVADLAGSVGGRIVITGTLAGDLKAPLTITNTAAITATLEAAPGDNAASVKLPVSEPAGSPETP